MATPPCRGKTYPPTVFGLPYPTELYHIKLKKQYSSISLATPFGVAFGLNSIVFKETLNQMLCFFYSSLWLSFLQEQFFPSSPISQTVGGKNSFVGNSSRLNISQGLSEVVTHSFSGMQKSYAGISI